MTDKKYTQLKEQFLAQNCARCLLTTIVTSAALYRPGLTGKCDAVAIARVTANVVVYGLAAATAASSL